MAVKKFIFLFSFVLLLTLSAFAQESRKAPDPKKPTPEADEKIYTVQEVDIEAELKNLDEAVQEFQAKFSCSDPDTEVILSIVLNKSGKVSDVKVEITSECTVPEKAIEELKKIKFTPAIKTNVPVSELFQIQMRLM
jgi:hypothetical protein